MINNFFDSKMEYKYQQLNLKFRIFVTTLTVHFYNFVPFLLFIQNKQIN